MTRFLICAVPMLVIAVPAVAQQMSTEAAAAPVAAPAVAPVKPKKVCRTVQITGRRIAQTSCYTAAQWAEYDRANDEAAQKLVSDVSSTGARSNLQGGSSGGLDTSSLFGLGPH